MFRSRNGSPIAFDENADCPRFINELLRPALADDDIELLQKFAGQFLLGYNRAQKILILDGPGGTGKSTFIDVIQNVIGCQNCTQLHTAQLGERFEIFRYLHKSLLIGSDVEADFLSTKGASILKSLTGGDWLDCEGKGLNSNFPTQGRWNVAITSNARLRVRLQGDVSAWRRRLAIVRFNGAKPSKPVPDFAGLLIRQEGPGILNWALGGVAKLIADIPDTGGSLAMSSRQTRIIDSLLNESDSLRAFVGECLIGDDGGDISGQELRECYGRFCAKNGWRPFATQVYESQIDDLILEIFGVSKNHHIRRGGKSVRGYSKIILKSEVHCYALEN